MLLKYLLDRLGEKRLLNECKLYYRHTRTCTEIKINVMISWDVGLINFGGVTDFFPCSKIL